MNQEARPTLRLPFASRPDDRRAAWRLFALCMAVYLLTFRGHLGSRDEESLYMTTVMLEKRAEAALHVAWTAPEPGDARTPAFGVYEPGQPLLALPWYLLGDGLARFFPLPDHTYITRAVVTVFTVLVTAATAAQVYRFGRAVGYSARLAAATALVYAFATPAWPYSRTFFRDPVAALAVISAALAAVRWRAGRARRDGWEAVAWLALGVAVKFTTVILAPVLAVYALIGLGGRGAWRALPGRRRYRLALIVAASGLALMALAGLGLAAKWDEIRGHYYGLMAALQGGPQPGYVGRAFYGLTLSPGKGLLVFAPPVLAAAGGLALWARRRPAPAWLCAGSVTAYLVVYSFDTGWHGGASWGPRYLLPVLPLAVAPFAAALRAAWRARARPIGRLTLGALALLTGAGVLAQVAGLLVDPIHYDIDVVSRRPVTQDPGPDYLQEIHFDPALAPIPGALGLGVALVADVAARRTTFYPPPYGPTEDTQYFQYLQAPDFAWLHLAGWLTTRGWAAPVNWHARTPEALDPAASLGRTVAAGAGAPAPLISTPHEPYPSGPYRLVARLRSGVGPGRPVARLRVMADHGIVAGRVVAADELPASGGYGEAALDVTLSYGPAFWFEVESTGAGAVALDRVWLAPAGPLHALGPDAGPSGHN